MTNQGYCRKCGKRALLCDVKTVSPTGSFGKQYRVCIPCVKEIEAFIEGKDVQTEDKEQLRL